MHLIDVIITFNAADRKEASDLNSKLCEELCTNGVAARAEFVRSLGKNLTSEGYAVRAMFLVSDLDAAYQALDDCPDILVYEDIPSDLDAITEAAFETRRDEGLDDLDFPLFDDYEDLDGGEDSDEGEEGEY